MDGRRRPWPGAIFDDVAYAGKRTGRTGWVLAIRNHSKKFGRLR